MLELDESGFYIILCHKTKKYSFRIFHFLTKNKITLNKKKNKNKQIKLKPIKNTDTQMNTCKK